METPPAAEAPSLDDLLDRYCSTAEPNEAARHAAAAKRAAGFFARWPDVDAVALPEELDATQRRVAEVLAQRDDVHVGGAGLPASPRRLREWLGLAPPSILDRRLPHPTGEGKVVSWPLWRIWADADEDELEHNQGVPARFAEWLTPPELIALAAEGVLEQQAVGSPLESRVMMALQSPALASDAAVRWARDFAERIGALRSPEGPHARPEAAGYQLLGIYDWDTLGVLALTPLVRAGVRLEDRWDTLVPFTGPRAMVRDILGVLPEARREAVLYRRLTTDWGPGGERALNGFEDGFALLDLAPSERVARILVQKLRHNRSHFARRRARILEDFAALAAQHPGVAAALKPTRSRSSSR